MIHGGIGTNQRTNERVQPRHGSGEHSLFDLFDFHSQSDSRTSFHLFDDRSRDTVRNTGMPLCEEPSSLFRQEAAGNPSALNGPDARIEVSLAVT